MRFVFVWIWALVVKRCFMFFLDLLFNMKRVIKADIIQYNNHEMPSRAAPTQTKSSFCSLQ